MYISNTEELYNPRLISYERREQIIAVYAVPQSDEPPGRPAHKEELHVLAEHVTKLDGSRIRDAIRQVYNRG